MNVPSYPWREAILYTNYLMNRMPSKVLNFKTPISLLHKYYLKYRLINYLPLYIFGCTVFSHNSNKRASKLDLKGIKYVIRNYSKQERF